MFRTLLRDRKFLFLLILAILIRLFSLRPDWVERYYSQGIYPFISRLMRILFGWIPFSVGDLLYIAAFVFLVLKTWKFLRLLASRRLQTYLSRVLFAKYLKLVLLIYVVFNIGWGLNYNREGIAHQLNLTVKDYTRQDLKQLAILLRQRLNANAIQSDSVKRLRFNENRQLFRQGFADFQHAAQQFTFLRYASPSIKPSLYGSMGKYFGYTGYYNPFTGESHIKTSVPVFVKPFVVNHEIAHQLGYAKENEANFVSFLVSKTSMDPDVRYSMYYEMYFYAFYRLIMEPDSTDTLKFQERLHPRVLADKMEELNYQRKNRNSIQPFMTGAYNHYLKLNNQPKGMATYNEVLAWMIAYMKKYGPSAL